MSSRSRWQYCQVEVYSNTTSTLRQFFPDRGPVESDLHANWPGMLAKLGDQGWELVGVVSNGSVLGRNTLIYAFKRLLVSNPVVGGSLPTQPAQPSPPPAPEQPDEDEPEEPDFRPLDLP